MVGRPGTYEHIEFNNALAHNWEWLRRKEVEWSATQGETAGWVPTYYPPDGVGLWQQYMLAGTLAFGARLGDDGARRFLEWQINWLTGPALVPGFNHNDIFASYYHTAKEIDGKFIVYNTWAQLHDRIVADGLSQPAKQPGQGADYAPRALSALAAVLSVFPNDQRLLRTYDFARNSGAFLIDKPAMLINTNLSIVPLR